MKVSEMGDFQKKRGRDIYAILWRRAAFNLAKLVGSRKYFIYFCYLQVTHALMMAFAFDGIPDHARIEILVIYAIYTVVTMTLIGLLTINPVDIDVKLKNR